ncbi:MerR family transcriptional regulator [Phenylobacterium sp.]|uniref:MerR family transcriptional regulator n=1 Tax=Phenylobacterium sp. TaxID=1871053 RepID=UPI003BAAC5B6
MSSPFLSPAEAARRLGVSAKALRLYEERGLLAPDRTAAGYRAYGQKDMARAAEIADLRALGLSLSQVARVLDGEAAGLEPALAAHQASLEGQARHLASAMEKVARLRTDLARGQAPGAGDLAGLLRPGPSVGFDLPWPWGGERFELRDIAPLTFITGPLGSGKTRLAKRLAETLPGGVFLAPERRTDGVALARLKADLALKARVDRDLAWLVEEGATPSDALLILLTELEREGPLVIDLVEQDLDEASQEALMVHLRRRDHAARPLFLLTRSCAILDLAMVTSDEAILLCPANHNPPIQVAPYPGAPGYEAVATCLSSAEARARTEGVIALRPQVA